MQLVLELCSAASAQSRPLAVRKVFDGVGGVIGRGNGCDWVIPDPSRLLSSHHGMISYRDGRYFLTDISRNGIGVVGSDERLRRGHAHAIHDGIVFEMGTLAIRAGLVTPMPRLAEPAPIPDDAFLALAPLPLLADEVTVDDTLASWTERGTPERDHLVTPTLAEPVREAPVTLALAPVPETNDGFWAHFAQALGIPMDALDTPRREALAVKAASLLKHTLDDVQQCLHTCQALKQELSLEALDGAAPGYSLLQDRGALLGAGAVGELPAHQAVSQAFRDLQAHQVAMLAACRVAVRGARQAFAPDHLQRCFARQGKPSRLFADGAHWRAYQRYYQQLIEDAASGEPSLGGDFFSVYQDQVRLIATLHAGYPG